MNNKGSQLNEKDYAPQEIRDKVDIKNLPKIKMETGKKIKDLFTGGGGKDTVPKTGNR